MVRLWGFQFLRSYPIFFEFHLKVLVSHFVGPLVPQQGDGELFWEAVVTDMLRLLPPC